jgi:hypothetical protein
MVPVSPFDGYAGGKRRRLRRPGLVFKEATTNDEMAQFHRLNHQTFAEELRQYASNEREFWLIAIMQKTATLLR